MDKKENNGSASGASHSGPSSNQAKSLNEKNQDHKLEDEQLINVTGFDTAPQVSLPIAAVPGVPLENVPVSAFETVSPPLQQTIMHTIPTPGAYMPLETTVKVIQTPEHQKRVVTLNMEEQPKPVLEPLMPKGLRLPDEAVKKTLADVTKHRVRGFGNEPMDKKGADEEFKRAINTYLPSRTIVRKKKLSTAGSLNRAGSRLPIYYTGAKDSSNVGFHTRPLQGTQFRMSQTVSNSRRLGSQFMGANYTPDFAEIAVEDDRIGDDTDNAEENQWQQLATIRSSPVNMNEKRKLRADILQADVELATGKAAFDLQHHKVQEKIKDFIKEYTSKLRIWSSDLKLIEGHFGTGVVSYFIFLKWLLLLNSLICSVFLIFIVLPQALFAEIPLHHDKNITLAPITFLDSNFTHRFPSSVPKLADQLFPKDYSGAEFHDTSLQNFYGSGPKLDKSDVEELGLYFDTYAVPEFLDVTLYAERENYTTADRYNLSRYCAAVYFVIVKNRTEPGIAARLRDFLEGSGWMANTLMFTGYYEPSDVLVGTLTYNMPVAFLAVLLSLVIVCIAMMLNYASKGIRENLVEGSMQMKYCHILFCGWDYCIANEETAELKQTSILRELKSDLLEERRNAEIKQWTFPYKCYIFVIRFVMNIGVLMSLVGSYYLVYFVAKKQLESERTFSSEGLTGLAMKFMPAVTISALNFVMPLIFVMLVPFEHYTTVNAINMVLLRSVFLRLASVVILISSFYHQITCSPQDQCGLGEDTKLCPSPICWETYVGQQMYRLVIMDFIIVFGVTFCWEVPRNYVVQRYKNKLTIALGRQVFDIPTEVLSVLYSQTLCWVGMFYSPLLPALCVIKIISLFYLKKFTVLHNCIPAEVPYKASRSNSIFMVVLMLSFFIVVAILGYSVSRIIPSPGCSPFRYYNHMINAVNDAMQTWSPELNTIVSILFSSLFAIPAIVLLCLAIYYYLTLSTAHKQMVKVLKVQLALEGRDKQFLLARLTEVARQDAKRGK